MAEADRVGITRVLLGVRARRLVSIRGIISRRLSAKSHNTGGRTPTLQIIFLISCIVINLPLPWTWLIQLSTSSIHALLFQPELVSHQVDRITFNLIEQLVHKSDSGIATGT